jgi:hypothetical protein
MPKHIFVAQLLPCYGHIVFHSPFAQDHPMHLHGHDFGVLGSGYGEFDSSNPNSLTLVDAPRRDVAMMPASGYLVIAIKTNNPGVSPPLRKFESTLLISFFYRPGLCTATSPGTPLRALLSRYSSVNQRSRLTTLR